MRGSLLAVGPRIGQAAALTAGVALSCPSSSGASPGVEELGCALPTPALTKPECVDVLVATPGRLIAHMQSTPGFTLRHLKYLVRMAPSRAPAEQITARQAGILDKAGKVWCVWATAAWGVRKWRSACDAGAEKRPICKGLQTLKTKPSAGDCRCSKQIHLPGIAGAENKAICTGMLTTCGSLKRLSIHL
eukprot:365727-Chlamydomonas_euryale.AAC.2